MTVLIATGTSAANSADFLLAAGESATLCLVDANGGEVPNQALALIQFKAASGQYMNVGRLTKDEPVKVLDAKGTWRVVRPLAPVAFGVDRE